MKQAFRMKLRVRYSECDAQEVVFNARYADYADLASTEYFRRVLGGIQTLNKKGEDVQVVRLLIEWKNSARFDDVLTLSITTEHVGNTSFKLALTIECEKSELLIATGEMVYVLVDNQNFQKKVISEDLRRQLLQENSSDLIDFSGVQIK